MSYGITSYFKSDYGLFTRPELKAERYTYSIITPSAARGMIEAIFWKPGMRYIVDEIAVLNPIRYVNIKRNEISKKIPSGNIKSAIGGSNTDLFLSTSGDIVQRNSTVLYQPYYVIKYHFELTEKAGPEDTKEKYYNMILRRLKKGQCYHQPCMGVREFPARFGLYEEEIVTPYKGEIHDFGLMLYDMDYSNKREIKPTFFHAIMENGVVDLTKCEVIK